MLVTPSRHTELLVGLGLFRLADNRQGFLARTPRDTYVKDDPESLSGTVLVPWLDDVVSV